MAAPAARSREPLRILTAVPLCDGHDSAITTINLEFARSGIEVVYLGYHQSASAIARAAVQEDVRAIGLSSYNGGHVVFFREVLRQLQRRDAADIRLFGGGGGTITAADERLLRRAGVDRIFFAGTPLDEIVMRVRTDYTRPPNDGGGATGDRKLAREITLAERGGGTSRPVARSRAHRALSRDRGEVATRRRGFVVGIGGPGGAGKSTLIDELTSRFLRANPGRRIAIVANDPSHPSGGAILGDRVSAIYAQDDRVFFRSLATRGNGAGLSAAAPAVIEILRASFEFDLILVESIGIGQDSDPFGLFAIPWVDTMIFVLAPHYGGPIQLQKIALLERADLVVLNKCDDPRAAAARTELAARLGPRAGIAHHTVAAQHHDPGVDRLYAALETLAGLEPTGGERACQLRIHD